MSLRFALIPLLALSLSSCSTVATSLAKDALLGGGGPSVNANAQVGKKNKQQITVGTSTDVKGDNVQKQVEAQKVDNITVQNVDRVVLFWLILSLVLAVAVGVLGWVLPSPKELFRRKK